MIRDLFLYPLFFLFHISGVILGQESVLKKAGSYSIPLDVNTGFIADCIQVFSDGGKEYLALGYRLERKINIYDSQGRKLLKTIHFEMEGPNGVGTEIPAFYMENLETVFIYSYWQRTIYISDLEGNILDKIKIPDNQNYPIIEPGSMCPIVKLKGHLYLSGRIGSPGISTRIHPFVAIELASKKARLLGKCPEATQSWNFYHKNAAKYDFIFQKNLFVISFDMSDSLYLTDFSSTNKRYLAKSKYIKSIPPLSKNKNHVPSKEERFQYAASDSYYGVKYDPFQKCYYRFVVRGRSMSEVYSYKIPETTVIVLDENFKSLGEYILPKFSFIEMCFITKNGLHIANQQIYNELNEDELSFDVYKVNR